jgi:hypothetical protein
MWFVKIAEFAPSLVLPCRRGPDFVLENQCFSRWQHRRRYDLMADDVEGSTLKALSMGKPVCIPTMPDIADLDAMVAAELQSYRPMTIERQRIPRLRPSHRIWRPV